MKSKGFISVLTLIGTSLVIVGITTTALLVANTPQIEYGSLPTPQQNYYIGADKYSQDPAVWAPYYKDIQGNWQDINNEIVGGVMNKADYSFRLLQNTFNAGRIIEYSEEGQTIQFQPMPIQWTNDLDQISQIAIPQAVLAITTNTPIQLREGVTTYQGSEKWVNAYGNHIDFEWICRPNRLSKAITIKQADTLPIPPSNIIAGGNPVFRFSQIFDTSSDISIYVDGVLWTKAANSKMQTFNAIEFTKTSTGGHLWSIAPMLYWDSNGNEGESIKTVRRVGSSLYIDIRVPYSWLQTAVYPVYIDADIAIDSSIYTLVDQASGRGGVFWTTPLVGYVIYLDSTADITYRKTSDGGGTWGSASALKAHSALSYDTFADWQVAGDAGTRIHVAYIDSDTDDVRYCYLETATDTWTGDDQIVASAGAIDVTPSKTSHYISITKTRGGNIAVAYRFLDTSYRYGFYTSPDATTWTSKSSPWEAANNDYLELYPANLADSNDLWVAFGDSSADAISLKTFDNSANSWSEAAIAAMVESNLLSPFDGQIRLSDGHLILAFWNAYDVATADLQVYDITDAGTITAKTNIITNEAESAGVSVFINQVNDDLYVAYFSGTAFLSTVKVFSQHSHDGGTTWSGETAFQENAEENERWLSAGCMKAAWGGKFQPVFQDDDDNDLFTNTTNGISIDASDGGAAYIPKIIIH